MGSGASAERAPNVIQPTSAAERIVEIDILRGLALFGILVVNFSSPTLGYFDSVVRMSSDRWFKLGVETLFLRKMYPLFSILFGVGMILQMEHAPRLGFVNRYLRRLGALFAFGLLHHLLIWNGDILHWYAMFGVLLLILHSLPQRALVLGGIVLVMIPSMIHWIPATLLPAVPIPENPAGLLSLSVRDPNQTLAYGELVFARWNDLLIRGSYIRTYLGTCDLLGFFLLGVWLGRTGLIRNAADHRRELGRIFFASLPIGVIGLIWDFASPRVLLLPLIPHSALVFIDTLMRDQVLRDVVKLLQNPALAIAIGSGALLAMRSQRFRRFVHPASAIGRTALTNYLGISLAGVFLFMGLGLGLAGKTGFTLGVVLAICFYGIQMVSSNLWLRHFRFGPMEWLWRSITYARVQPLRAGSPD